MRYERSWSALSSFLPYVFAALALAACSDDSEDTAREGERGPEANVADAGTNATSDPPGAGDDAGDGGESSSDADAGDGGGPSNDADASEPPSPNAAAMIAAGENDTCVVTYGGAVKCWGANLYGELGDDTTFPSYTPVTPAGWSSGVARVAVGYAHVCALKTDGSVECLGFNNSTQLGLGNGSTDDHHAPVKVNGLTGPMAGVFARGCNSYSVGVDGRAWGWGCSSSGQTGDSALHVGPMPINGLLAGVVGMTVGDYFACALLGTGGVKCLGNNSQGELGNKSSVPSSSTPVDVWALSSGVTSVAAGGSHACAAKSDDSVQCWGSNRHGELGTGSAGPFAGANYPRPVSGLPAGTMGLAAGTWHTCALTGSGGVMCWGGNGTPSGVGGGQLGNGTTDDSSAPVVVSGLSSGVTAIAAGGFHTCAITGGRVMCWGHIEAGSAKPKWDGLVPVVIAGF
ncbi:BNR repeat domain protein [Labilithrix luteola]|uniref:BNR repeat domain protein n=1 Tax=Labilithrix luteola TaxID=1391654 RepID=A0A0K1PP73_9BACT|nr:hypothetical protein [Labilithrix luteola]AKU95307.1 BNR repeat domain protein [Labilithrix luteola]